jgi:zinc protease
MTAVLSAARRFAAAALAGALMTLAAAAHAEGRGVYFPETFTLSNGLQVVVVTNRRVPVVTHMIWYKVGSADEPYGRSGLAHFLEHLMFKGTDAVPAGEFSKIVAKNGGRDNAFTSYDYTAYYQSVARDRLELVMKMEADRMTGLRLTDDAVYPERDVIVEERRQRTENDPNDRLGEQFDVVLHPRHPYGTPVIGWGPEMSSLTRGEAESFYKTWYAPNNAVLVVTGDVDAAELKPLAEKYYGGIAPHAVPARVRPADPPLDAARRVALTDDDIHQPLLRRSWTAPSYRTAKAGEAYALQVLCEIMASGSDSRLYHSLVVEKKIATQAWLAYNPSALDDTQISAGAVPAPGADMAEVEKALEAELARVAAEGVSDEELARARARMLGEAAYARDSIAGPAQVLGSALATGQTVADVEAWPERIEAVTRESVNTAARAFLSRTNHVTGLLLPGKKEP